MHLLLLTTTNLSANPRLVKDIRLALSNGYKVTVVLFDLRQWTTELEKLYQQEFNEVKLIYLPLTRRSLFSWLQTTVLHQLAKLLNRVFPFSLELCAWASDKRSILLTKKLKELSKFRYDFVVSHNLGTLFPAFILSKKYNLPFIFDVEDYHPGEFIHVDAANEKRRRELLMQKILCKASFVTAASPLIAREVEKLCQIPVFTINNSFYSNEFDLPLIENNLDEKLKLVWFSQNINHGRGLELLLPALDPFCDAVTLTLIGNINSHFSNQWIQHRKYLKVIAPLKQDILHKELSKYDVGLALELISADYNRNIALTNKIFAYKQAGLFVLVTDTKAQVEFMNHFMDEGYICEQTIDSIKSGISYILENLESIRAEKGNRFFKAKEIAFESEAQKLLALWNKATFKQA
ncbi:hypothetical protein H8S95_05395 [Pontibacter sp. KCTC 32443]|uniref:glycosyltransferase n=1 Tax=Pontibacter TaxID=323449 RepID=UPI00164E415C|nr:MULTISPECIES: glycosyltransferase [Pontibacter]MBC5773490.1 hypothetical protein [Pontibacter sp. KCTC 32443]